MVPALQRVLPVCAVLGAASFVGPIGAQVPVKKIQIGGSGKRIIRAVAPVQARAVALVPSISGHYLLRLEHVREELELTDEQRKQLDETFEWYQDQTRQGWGNLQGLSQEERQAKMAETRRKSAERMETYRKRMDEVLSPGQREELEEIGFRMRAPSALANPRVLDQLGLDAKQRESLEQLRSELQEKSRRLQGEMLDKSLEVLTPEQRAKLREANAPGVKPG